MTLLRRDEKDQNKDHYIRVRCKTLKLLESPTIEELVAETALTAMWLFSIIMRDADLDLRLTMSDDNSEIHQIYRHLLNLPDTAEVPMLLDWRTLAGLVEKKDQSDLRQMLQNHKNQKAS